MLTASNFLAASPIRIIVIFLMSSFCSILLTVSIPFPATCPKIVCRPLSQGVATCVMKNWLLLVPGPEFAIAKTPPLSKTHIGDLIFKLITCITRAVTKRITALNHKIFNDAVKFESVKKRFTFKLRCYKGIFYLLPMLRN